MVEHKRGRLAQGLEGGPIEAAWAAPRCGARRKYDGQPCQRPALRGRKRCALHGGKSTGPTSVEGLERSRRANLKHGMRTREARAEQKRRVVELRQARRILAVLSKDLIDMTEDDFSSLMERVSR